MIGLDLAGCKVAFLTVEETKLSPATFRAMDELRNMGVGHVTVMKGLKAATDELVKIQGRHGELPPDKKFLRLTRKGQVVNLFV